LLHRYKYYNTFYEILQDIFSKNLLQFKKRAPNSIEIPPEIYSFFWIFRHFKQSSKKLIFSTYYHAKVRKPMENPIETVENRMISMDFSKSFP
jgi:hypothetical protein